MIAAYLLSLVFLRPSKLNLRHMEKSTMTRSICILFACAVGSASAADAVKLTLPEAVLMARLKSHALKIAPLKVVRNGAVHNSKE